MLHDAAHATIPNGADSPWPRAFGRYVLLAPLAHGGMGEVSLALVGALQNAQRLCVIKTIRPEYAHEPAFVDRFLDEGRMLCALNHPNIAQVLEVGIEATTPFVALEHIAGVDLDTLLAVAREQGVRLSPEFAINVLAGVLDGMSFAHDARALDGTALHLVHRDLSPQNLRLSWEGEVKVIDFGTAHGAGRSVKTAHGVVYGKPGYMSPDQCRGEALDARSDLFSIGVVAWEILADRDFADPDGGRHMQALATGNAPVPRLSTVRWDVPAAFDAWVQRMTAYDKNQRYPTAAAARKALSECARELGAAIDRDGVASVMASLFGPEREAERDHIRRLVGTARTLQITAADVNPRAATTEPLPTSDQNLIHGTRYRIGARLGAGGVGEVFAAEHIDLGRTVAMKILYGDPAQPPGIAQRFRLEARAIASLSHPNLVHIYDFGTTDDGRLFYAMERLLGETLRDRIARVGRLPMEECVRIGVAVARGLAAAHAVSLVHRDIKPENIFLTQDGGVKVLDFGIAKTTNAALLQGAGPGAKAHATRQGEIFGSPGYMAPEQARGAADADARTDLYALGVVLYECASGTELFRGQSLVELLAQHLTEAPEPLSTRAPDARLPRDFEAVVMLCLAKSPDARPQTAQELISALERCLSPEATGAAATPPTRPTAATPAGPPTVPAVPAPALPPPSAVQRFGPPLLGLSGACAVVALLAATRHPNHSTPPSPVRPVAPIARPQGLPDAAIRSVAPTPAPALAALAPPDAAVEMPARTPPSRPPPSAVESVPARVHEAPPAERNHFALAQRAMDARQYDTAIEEAERAIEHNQGGVRARNLLGLANMRAGRRADAVRAWRMVLARDPDNGEARRLLQMAGETP